MCEAEEPGSEGRRWQKNHEKLQVTTECAAQPIPSVSTLGPHAIVIVISKT